ncbi:MAG: 1-deoxy-D-xylulose-5-phosphate synthase [Alphaproteobacteria bacterium]|jgi:1-deoxy-D-xylulose-5-phosphate synthase|uniref:1-deoxy-D-xylulose-5-phosphate synthase n=1 Tax=Candidatus Scatocola faecigallinarum TaxID=2840916 RepID=UPI003A364E6A
MSYLDNINSPADVKKLSLKELEALAEEIRSAVLNRDSKIGGHVGPNLGIVETTIALHYVFNSPEDKIVYDVSHQSYPHKILTGRKNGFLTDEGMREISGYTNPAESEHDHFIVGHTSTSVSLACGLAKARDLKGEKHNVIAVIGDGSLSGGEALEGFDNAAVLNSNIIIIVNDNEMSIAENHGGLYGNLRLLRQTGGKAECNMFKALGFDYRYLEEGNDIAKLTSLMKEVKDTDKPTVLHIHTEKGKGYKPAEEHKETWHWSVPFDIASGNPTVDLSGENYNSITVNYLQEKIAKDKKVVLINAGTPGAIGMTPDMRQKFGRNFVDVGIAEEHGVAMASALAKGGCKPVFWVLSSFVQRTYDQLSQDLALNKNPAVILIGWNGISGGDATHLGTFDIPLISNIPNLVYLAPTTKEEYLSMLDWGIEQTAHPVVIRIPSTVAHAEKETEKTFERLNTYKVEQQGSNVALIAAGSFFELGRRAAAKLAEQGITATLVNPRYLTGLDENLLNSLKADHKIVATLEDGELDGGFGEKIARFYGDSNMKVLNFGAKKEFTDRVPVEELYKRYHLTPELIAADILKAGN